MIEIQEFSTGINYRKTFTGWRSEGLTGQFMNKTIPIPQAIAKAISNKEFAIAEDTATDIPALVGREITLYGEEWSVLAVIIRGTDEVGGYFPAYRYFYTKGRGNLDQLVLWWTAENYPVFNPIEPAEIRLYETQENIDIPLDNFQEFLDGKDRVVVPHNRALPPLIIHTIAQKIAGENDIAWAWNVGGLEDPKNFQAIYPDSPEATELIYKAILSQPFGVIRGEYGLKLTIENLMKQEPIKTEDLLTLETSLSNRQITEKRWKSYFDDQGASQAISQRMYNPNLVRLLTLRAIIIPNTLPEFLGWLQVRSKEKEHYQTSLNFQHEILRKISKNFPKLANKVMAGVKLIIPHLLEQPELLAPTIWLLGSNNSGIWASLYSNEVKPKIEHDLSLMSDLAGDTKNVKKQLKSNIFSSSEITGLVEDLTPILESQRFALVPQWEQIWKQIKEFWLPNKVKPLGQYLPLAKLFEQLRDYKISAVFYQIATGSVPNSVFKKVTKNAYKYTLENQLRIEKYVSKSELLLLALTKISKKIGDIIMPIGLVVPLVLAGIFVGGIAGYFTKDLMSGNNKNTYPVSSVNIKKSEVKTLLEAGLNINVAQNKINESYAALQGLVKNDDNKKKKLVQILETNANDYSEEINSINLPPEDLKNNDFGDDKTKQNWIKAIFLYQKSNDIKEANGIISKNDATFKKLKAQMNQK